jgi:glycosyltransferase involved in cell wall biosynthesis
LINALERGGAEKVFIEEAQAFARLDYPVWLGTLRKGELVAPSDVSHVTFNFKNFYDVRGCLRLLTFIREQRITHLYATLDEATIVARLTALLLPRLSVSVRESGLPARKSFKLKLFDILFNWRVHKIVAVSSGVAQGLVAYQFLNKNKIVVVENGISPPSNSCQEYINAKVVHKEQPVGVIAVGRLTEEKNHHILLKAFARIKKNHPQSAHLTIIGGGPLHDKLCREIRELDIEGHVTLAGPLAFDKVKLAYENADIFVHSSLGEGFPNAVLEAMSYALPVLSTRVPGVDSAIEDGISGLLVKSGDDVAFGEQLEKLISDHNLRIRLGVAGCERVRSCFSFERHMEHLIEVL